MPLAVFLCLIHLAAWHASCLMCWLLILLDVHVYTGTINHSISIILNYPMQYLNYLYAEIMVQSNSHSSIEKGCTIKNIEAWASHVQTHKLHLIDVVASGFHCISDVYSMLCCCLFLYDGESAISLSVSNVMVDQWQRVRESFCSLRGKQ